jgi:NAD-dependent deacetylase
LVALEKEYEVVIVTQNVDDLHERAGSSRVIHLHGQLFQSRSTHYEDLVYPMTSDRIELGEVCEKGHQLRPNIVWFGEAVPLMERAIEEAATADIFMVVGTSLQVYPAAGLVQFAPQHAPIYVIDPHQPPLLGRRNVRFITAPASTGVPQIAAELLAAI